MKEKKFVVNSYIKSGKQQKKSTTKKKYQQQ